MISQTSRQSVRLPSTEQVLLYTVGILFALVSLTPVLWILQMSLKTTVDALSMPPRLIFVPSLANYVQLLQDKVFLGSFVNSAIVSTATTVLSMLLGAPAAYGLARASYRGRGLLGFWVLVTRMAPPIAFGIPFFLIYSSAGLIDTRLGLVLIYLTFNLSLVVWMMRSFFEAMPRSLEDASLIDGANLIQAFTRVTLPLSAPGLAATAILCFLFSWNDFFYALILTRQNAMTAPVAIVGFMNYEGWEWGKIAAGGVLIMLPVLVFALAVRRYLVRGLTAGAVKG